VNISLRRNKPPERKASAEASANNQWAACCQSPALPTELPGHLLQKPLNRLTQRF